MQVIKVTYNGIDYTKDWEQKQTTYPVKIDELVIFLILINQILLN